MRNFRNLHAVRLHCYQHKNALGVDDARDIRVENGLFVLDPVGMGELSKWMRALRTAAWLNQDGLCICGKQLKQAELHHALVSKRDVQGLSSETKNLIHHSYNVVLVHPECHIYLTRDVCFRFLRDMYGLSVFEWYIDFPIKSKLSLA